MTTVTPTLANQTNKAADRRFVDEIINGRDL